MSTIGWIILGLVIVMTGLLIGLIVWITNKNYKEPEKKVTEIEEKIKETKEQREENEKS